jgi:hypothetical protein
MSRRHWGQKAWTRLGRLSHTRPVRPAEACWGRSPGTQCHQLGSRLHHRGLRDCRTEPATVAAARADYASSAASTSGSLHTVCQKRSKNCALYAGVRELRFPQTMKHSAESSPASREGLPKDPNSTSVLDDVPEFTRYRPGGVFLVIGGPDRGEQVVLTDRPITIGSSPSCELVLSDRTVSRRHATAVARKQPGGGARPRLDQRQLHLWRALQRDRRRLRHRDHARQDRAQVLAAGRSAQADRERGRSLRQLAWLRRQDAAAVWPAA